MKYWTLFLGIISCIVVSAQKASSTAKSKQIFAGFSFSPDYAYRVLKNNGGDDFAPQIISSRNDMEIGKLGFTAGLDVGMNISRLFRVEAGVQFSNKSYETRKQEMYYQQPPPDPLIPLTAKFIYNYQYIDVPLKLKLVVGKKRIHFTSVAGVALNFLLNANTRSLFEYPNGSTRKQEQSSTYDFKKFNISPLVSLGAEYRVKNNLYIKMEPTFRYGLLKTIDRPVTEYLWSAGLNIGFYFAL